MNSPDQDPLDEWIRHRRRSPEPDSSFTAAVMAEISPGSESGMPSPPPSRHSLLPRPLLASLCLGAGAGKLFLIIHLAF